MQQMQHGGSFLVRASTTCDGYAISLLLEDGRVEHHKLAVDTDGVFMLNDNYMSISARTVPEAVEHLYDSRETLSQPLSRNAYAHTTTAGVVNTGFHGATSNTGYVPDMGADMSSYDNPSTGTPMRGHYHEPAVADAGGCVFCEICMHACFRLCNMVMSPGWCLFPSSVAFRTTPCLPLRHISLTLLSVVPSLFAASCVASIMSRLWVMLESELSL